jgi:NADH-quinone oxidoreductase subunit C
VSIEVPADAQNGVPAESVAAGIAGLAGIISTSFRGDEILFPTREHYIDTVTALKDASFVTCSDLCGVDYLTHFERALPEDVVPERFEIVVNVLSHALFRRIRIRVQIPERDAHCPTLFSLYPGTENMEREVFDMFGISFDGHPDMTRILMPADWEGHPLRKDYSVGRVPVQFKEAPGPR